MAILLHALAAFVLGNFRLASFLERAHSGFSIASRIQPSNPQRCNLVLCCDFEYFSDDCESITATYLKIICYQRTELAHRLKRQGSGHVPTTGSGSIWITVRSDGSGTWRPREKHLGFVAYYLGHYLRIEDLDAAT
jgi:hypothetical protein